MALWLQALLTEAKSAPFVPGAAQCVAMCHAVQVLEAAVVGIPHPKWGERPLLVVVPQPQFAPGE